MSGHPGLSFAGLLRQLRTEARLTQEELAEAARVSARAVSDLERGVNRTAHKDTAQLLAAALGLDPSAGELFVAAARGRVPAEEVLTAGQRAAPGTFAAAATRALPRDIASFTGRQTELAWLLESIDSLPVGGGVVGIHAIDGMAGIGKTTLAVHAAHRLAEAFPDGQFFLPLHAHTPGQQSVDPTDALVSLLLTAGLTPQLIPPGLQARAARWRDQVAGKRILLLLDDAASHEQVAPLLPGTAGSLVLITSRRRLAALPDAAVISLDTLSPEDATALLARLAGWPAINAGDAAVGEVARLCGYLPLAIGMLASQLRHHPAWTPGGLAADLAQGRDRLSMMRAENISVAVAFDLSYRDLTPGQQRLFRRLGLVPGPGVDTYAAAALDGTGSEEARRSLNDLYDQHLLTEPAPGRYQLHDLLREHARELAADELVHNHAVGRLLDYYLHTAAAANRLIARRPPTAIPPVACPPQAWPQLASQKEAEAWLEAERANLYACADHAASHALAVHAVWIPAQVSEFLGTHGYWDQALTLHQTAAAIAGGSGDRVGQATALHNLGHVRLLRGEYHAALTPLQAALRVFRDLGDQSGQVDVLNLLGQAQSCIDDRLAAKASVAEALTLSREVGDRLGQAGALFPLATLQEAAGDWAAAVTSFGEALALSRDLGDDQGRARTLTSAGLLQIRMGDYELAADSLTEAISLCRDLGDPLYKGVALIRLGAVYRLTCDYQAAAIALTQGLALVQELGSRHREGEAFLELGALQHTTGDHQTAATSLARAVTLFQEVDDPTALAETLNFLGALQAATLGPAEGLARYSEALSIARDIGSPLEEADALDGIGCCHMQAGDTAVGAVFLRQALDIYQRIGSPTAQHVQKTLNEHAT